jgi:diacylglycerol kinase family enzyme
MHFIAVLNREGGTLRNLDLDSFEARMRTAIEAAGHTLDIRRVEGDAIEEALKAASRARKADVVMVGGGAGTVSAAAAVLQGTSKVLAVLPAGTMNLFARSLGIPLNLDAAIAALANGKVRAVDMASANGRPFVHQFSIGMHAKMVHLRDRMAFGSRLGKIGASARAAYYAVMNPPAMRVSMRIGDADIVAKTTALGITNNLFGEGHLPYAEAPDGGVLGIYVTVAQLRGELFAFLLNMARGRWRRNSQVEIHQAETVVLTVLGRHGRQRAVIDGELVPLERETTLRIHPKSLKVLVPGDAAETDT